MQKKSTVLFLITVHAAVCAVEAHQAIAYPWPISNDGACRIGKFKNCPGPCPTGDLRLDQTPDSPSITVRRGQKLDINIKRNNHAGGFTRWAMVHVHHMHDKKKHEQAAFYYTCGDQRITSCNANNRNRDCTYDRRRKYYRHQIRIPEVYGNGVYVLGYAWYGGTQENGQNGDFGDYYDCMYVQVKGGPYKKWYQPTFKMGDSTTGKNGLCRARTNWIGDCWKEPCRHKKKARNLIPWQFSKGKKPGKLSNVAFRKPYTIRNAGKTAPRLQGISIRLADNPGQVKASSKFGSVAKLVVQKNSRITATCDVSGAVRHVIFYRNGLPIRKDEVGPFGIAGVYWIKRRGKFILRFHPWKVALVSDFYSLSCVVYGKDGSVQYAKLDVQQTLK